jgi:GNAT superfamily N-acetyltransferase
MTASTINFVSGDHPSLDGDLDRFLAELRSEQRRFGPSSRANPKPFPSLIKHLRQRGGFRVAAVERGRAVGLARVDEAGVVSIAVAADRRGWGIGAALLRATLKRAIALEYTRLAIHSTRRSWAIRRIGEQLGCTVVDGDIGRTDLIVELDEGRRSA